MSTIRKFLRVGRIYLRRELVIPSYIKSPKAFGSPFEKEIAEIIKIANEGKTGTWTLSAINT